jgi:glycolate oxidase
MDHVLEQLKAIVGQDYVSGLAEERYLYGRDQGVQPAHAPDYVVLPRTVDEIQQLLRLANRIKLPVVPMGGGLVLSGLTIPCKGGVVVDLKRMHRILEVNETSRYAVVEAGTSQGMLKAYLAKHHPSLKHSLPDAPPVATIAGNVAIHGSGHLSQSEGGFHSDMVTGLEVVLPTSQIARLGSCSTVPAWIARAPLPDLVGLFLGWNGTTGIITKVGLKLFPRPQLEDVLMFMSENLDALPDIIHRVTGTALAEDVTLMVAPKPDYFKDIEITIIHVTANSHTEMRFKKRFIREALQCYYETKQAGFADVPPNMKADLLDAPQKTLNRFADVKKGGGFEYVGGIMPLQMIPAACRAGQAIAERHATAYSLGARVIGRAHSVMFFYAYPFNRADAADMAQAARALEDTNAAVLKMGGIPWKAEISGQELILQRMDPQTKTLMGRIKATLDPNGIMNPGHWEVG